MGRRGSGRTSTGLSGECMTEADYHEGKEQRRQEGIGRQSEMEDKKHKGEEEGRMGN